MPSDSTESRVRDAYRLALASREGEAELRAAVAAFMAELRPENLPPEKVIVRLKTVMRDPYSFALDRRNTPPKPRLAESVILWCIQEYYKTD